MCPYLSLCLFHTCHTSAGRSGVKVDHSEAPAPTGSQRRADLSQSATDQVKDVSGCSDAVLLRHLLCNFKASNTAAWFGGAKLLSLTLSSPLERHFLEASFQWSNIKSKIGVGWIGHTPAPSYRKSSPICDEGPKVHCFCSGWHSDVTRYMTWVISLTKLPLHHFQDWTKYDDLKPDRTATIILIIDLHQCLSVSFILIFQPNVIFYMSVNHTARHVKNWRWRGG